MITVADREQRPIRHRRSIKIFEVPGHIENTPFPNSTKAEIISNPAVCLGGALGKGDGADNRTGQGETTQERHLKNHLVGGIPHLFVHVKSLGIQITHTLHLSKVLEEIPQAGREALEIAVVHGNAHLIQEQGAVGLWPEAGKHVHRNDTYTGNPAVCHISVDMVAALHVTEHLMNHVTGLTGPLFTEDEGKLIGVIVLLSQVGQAHQDKKKDSN